MNDSTKSILIWGAVIVGILALVFFLASLGSGGSGTNSATLSEGITGTDHVKGPRDASVVLVEYSDFQCPACGGVYPMVKQLTQDFPELAVVYRHYPLTTIHANAERAGQAAEAADIQAAFWEMHDVLFNTQSQWSSLPDPTDFFIQLAESIGLDVEQFTRDIDSSEARKEVADDLASATSMGLPGTPTFFLNGQQIQNPGSYAGFKQLIDAEFNK